MPIERLVRPPELPRHKLRKRIDLSAMSGAYLAALLTMFGVVIFAIALNDANPDAMSIAIGVLAIVVSYVCLGAALCAYVLRRLAWWNDATLAEAVHAKLDFIWTWPWSMGRLLYYLLAFHVFS